MSEHPTGPPGEHPTGPTGEHSPNVPEPAGAGDPQVRARRVVLGVDGLDGPPVGGGCCAASREDLLLDELESWPGLLTLDVDPDAATVAVLVQPGCPHLGSALEALADRGLPARVLSDFPAG